MKGVLLFNLGTPDSLNVADVKRYLAQFLMDPYVIDIPKIWRWLLVKGIILQARPKKSAHAYGKIWDPVRGSPLRFHSEDLVKGMQTSVPYPIALGMRYGQPSIGSQVKKLFDLGVTDLFVIPLYPQYSLAATETGIEELRIACRQIKFNKVTVLKDFFDEPSFVQACATKIATDVSNFNPDYLMFSYHGIPERHCTKLKGLESVCRFGTCCDQITNVNRACYRAQCFATTRAIMEELSQFKLPHMVCFQSRLAGTPWIKPYTDVELETIAKSGHRRLLVACPSFVADCLETLEEISMRAREDFIKFGGEDLKLVPSLNSDAAWASALAGWIEQWGQDRPFSSGRAETF